ncbi:MBL fold metallo-hydrolase [Ramlibacter sp.]|uniref:MBL fold metallo-hydrolase n=1 Tax=Ramlibacter sp. TaxID=1917967 RepID=UPI002C34208E|nr:MBL fold metallo-hydrolase [Ramlibacter sp.]HWI81108.1 MBL fold metallo-hydrolase [Ramlibacter sp.]
MDLQFLGATDTVTGSKYLLRTARSKVLVDCGLFQGYKNLRLRNWGALPVPAVDIDAIVLTHAHIDHSGYVPLLVRQGFQGPVFCTPATFDLCRILLTDSGHLLEEEADYLNEHGLSRHKPALPLYTREDAVRSLKLFKPVEFDTAWHASGDLQVRFSRSGHLPGSAFTQVDDGRVSVLFSGDLGRPADPVLQPPVRMRKADYLVVESTYGDRLHEREDVLAELAGVLNRTAGRGGVVLIPAFAVGRTQALMHLMHLLRERGAIPPIPIYLNSPMAASATQIYRRHLKELRLGAEDCEAMARDVQVVTTPEESRELNRRHGPMIIIAASGMATGGRVVHHVKAFAPDKRNTILLTGFQSGGTRGASIASGAPTVRIHGEDVPVRAEVHMVHSLSAHADAGEIMDWLRGFEQPPRRTFITHGEPPAADALRLRIERELHWACHLPYYLENVTLN